MVSDNATQAGASIADDVSPIAAALDLTQGIADRLRFLQAQTEIAANAIAVLEAAGVYEDEPSPSWENRAGKGRYLRLVFPTNGSARRKEYIGADPDKIAAALAKVKRTADARRVRNRLAYLQDYAKAAVIDLRNVLTDLRHAEHYWGQPAA